MSDSGKSDPIPELQPKAVTAKSAVGVSWRVILECGHEVYFCVDPGPRSFCGVCIDNWITRARKAGQVGD